jgi:hypothetical protein
MGMPGQANLQSRILNLMISMLAVFSILLPACSPGENSGSSNHGDVLPTTDRTLIPLSSVTETMAATSTAADIPSSIATPSATSSPTPSLIGPLEYPAGINPLTGLEMKSGESLNKAPILVSVTNFPPSARPQAGLSLASHVWETSIGQGMTRFLAVYYGDYVDSFRDLADASALANPYDFVIGPVRSGRIGFEEIKGMYPSGRLLIRYASPEVIGRLSNWELVTASNVEDINSAGISFQELQSLSIPAIDPDKEGGLAFDSRHPQGASPAQSLQILFNIYNRVRWDYSIQRGQYLRFQDASDGTEDLHPVLDRLTGEQLGFENVVVLWSYHRFENIQGTILELGLMYMPDGFGLLFRDGVVQPIRWSTLDGRLSLHDENGQPVPLKPGQTFFEVVSNLSTWDEQKSYVRFYSPAIPTATATTTPTATVTLTPEPATDTPTPSETP